MSSLGGLPTISIISKLALMTRWDSLSGYSLRHFIITQRILAGLSYEQVAKMCGTGRDQIESVDSQVTEESLRTAAYAD